MNLSEIKQVLSETLEDEADVELDGDEIKINDLSISQLDDLEFYVDGYSEFETLPKKFIFGSEVQVYSVLVPFILQCVDGERRI